MRDVIKSHARVVEDRLSKLLAFCDIFCKVNG